MPLHGYSHNVVILRGIGEYRAVSADCKNVTQFVDAGLKEAASLKSIDNSHKCQPYMVTCSCITCIHFFSTTTIIPGDHLDDVEQKVPLRNGFTDQNAAKTKRERERGEEWVIKQVFVTRMWGKYVYKIDQLKCYN